MADATHGQTEVLLVSNGTGGEAALRRVSWMCPSEQILKTALDTSAGVPGGDYVHDAVTHRSNRGGAAHRAQ